jgi:SPP1 gp7 family putative phage head morphogenesis protein
MERWLEEQSLELAGAVTETTRKNVEHVLKESSRYGSSVENTARDIERVFEEAKGNRARLIARTELNKAANGAGWLQATESGVVKTKTWMTAGDGRVRDEHAAMEGETVPLDEPFSNGLMFPSQPNCRCTLTYGLDEEALGMGASGSSSGSVGSGGASGRRGGGRIGGLIGAGGAGGRGGGRRGGGASSYDPDEIRRAVDDILRPEGEYVGTRGTGRNIRVAQGGEDAAREMFGRFSEMGAPLASPAYPGTLILLPEVGVVGYRPPEGSKPATIDVNIRGVRIKEIKFVE